MVSFNQISIPEDYYQWAETVASQGQGAASIIKVMRGPMWSGCLPEQIGHPSEVCHMYDLLNDQRKMSSQFGVVFDIELNNG